MRQALLAAATSLALTAGAAEADRGIILSLMPLHLLEIDSTPATAAVGQGTRVTQAKGSTRAFDFDLAGLSLVERDGRYHVGFDRLTVRERAGRGRAFQTSGKLVLHRLPGTARDPSLLCRYADLLISADLGETILDWSGQADLDRQSRLQQVRVGNLTIRQNLDGEACSFDGTVSLSDLLAQLSNGHRHTSDMLQVTGAFPVSTQSAAVGGISHATLDVSGFASTPRTEVPLIGIESGSLRFEMASQRTAPFLYLFGNYLQDGTPTNGSLAGAEMWNALLASQAKSSAHLDGLRLFLPGILASHLVANFSQAGLTYAMADVNVEFVQAQNDMELLIDLLINGLFHGEIVAKGSSRKLDITDLIDIRDHKSLLIEQELYVLNEVGINYQDHGMDAASNQLFGLPLGRLIERITGSTAQDGAGAGFFANISYAFRVAASGAPLSLSLKTGLEGGLPLPSPLPLILLAAQRNAFNMRMNVMSD